MDKGIPITFDNLTLGYDRHPVVHHVSLTIEKGALLAITGPNGGGKSTLLKALTQELKPLQGEVRFSTQADHASAQRPPLLKKKPRIAYLSQQNKHAQGFPVSVQEYVAMGLWWEFGLWHKFTDAAKEKIQHALVMLGIADVADKTISTLSGGQLQRARFARLLLNDAPIVLLDEPYAGIDEGTIDTLAMTVHHWHEEGRTVLSVLHDLDHIHNYYHQALLLAREVVCFGEVKHCLQPAFLEKAKSLMRLAPKHKHELCEM